MASTQRLEGPELEILLEEVPSRFGPDARVVAANRCRSGGVAGFFTRESFEVFVEVPEEGGPTMRLVGGGQDRAPRPDRTELIEGGLRIDLGDPHLDALEQMMAAADLADGTQDSFRTGAPSAAPERPSASTAGTTTSNPTTARPTRSESFDAVLRRLAEEPPTESHGLPDVSFGERTPVDPPPVPSVATHAGVPLALIPGSTWPDEAQDDEPTGRRARRAAKRSRKKASAATERRGGRARAGKRRGTGPDVITDAAPVARAAELMPLQLGPVAGQQFPPTASWDDAPSSEPTAWTASVPPVGSIPVSPSLVQPSAPARYGTAPSVAAGSRPASGVTTVPTGRALARLGVPTEWLGASLDTSVPLEQVLDHLKAAPPMYLGPGAVLAFVGELELSLPIARSVARALGLDPRTCTLLSPAAPADDSAYRRVRTIDEIGELRDRWQSAGTLTIVALESTLRRHDVAWARHALDALRPTSRWGIVDATRKAEDVRDWAMGLGGLDALALHGVGDTATPAAALSTGVPIARLDGRTASRDLWATVLGQRLAVPTRDEEWITA